MSHGKDTDDCCCPQLQVVGCGDSKEHNHPICVLSMTQVSNKTVREVCLGHWRECVFNKEWATGGGKEKPWEPCY